MRILFLGTRHNSLSQRAQVELEEDGHRIEVVEVGDGGAMEAAARRHHPDLVVAPMLKRAIPAAVWKRHTCLIVHPGIPGDRGPSSLDWAILDGAPRWGATVLEAREELDGGPVWAHAGFAMRGASKSALYRREVADAAMRALHDAVGRFVDGRTPLPESQVDRSHGRERPPCRQADRRVDWAQDVDAILRRIRSADSAPGLHAQLAGVPVRLFGASREGRLMGRPGQIIARRDGAVCVACGDGAVWISHVRRRFDDGDPRDGIKLPATLALAGRLSGVALAPLAFDAIPDAPTFQPIRYRERGTIGYLHFDLANGAMGTHALERLLQAYRFARSRDTRVIVLCGGEDFWSNGIDLNDIEASADPAQASWRNILAMNALVREIVETDERLVLSAVRGNAGAGGAVLALAADEVVARDGAVFNPHYRRMGGLYGSEYWTYLLPRRVGEAAARQLTESMQPVGTARAQRIGLIDARLPTDDLDAAIEAHARRLADGRRWRRALRDKARRRAADERRRPLQAYADAELKEMHRNFFGADPAYHDARRAFVRKIPAVRRDEAAERA